MPVDVVDPLEMIDVEDRQPELGLGEGGARGNTLERLDEGPAVEEARQLIVAAAMVQLLLERDNPLSGAQAHAQLLGAERLGNEVVGPRVQCLHQIGGRVLCRQHEHVTVGPRRVGSKATADFQAVDAGHHPVEEHERRRVRRRELLPGLLAIAGDRHRIAPRLEGVDQQSPREVLVLSDEHAQVRQRRHHPVNRRSGPRLEAPAANHGRSRHGHPPLTAHGPRADPLARARPPP